MTAFKDLDEFFDGCLDLTIGGKVYRVDPPDGELGLWLERMLAAGFNARAAQSDDEVEEQARRLGMPPGDPNMSFPQRMLGAAYDQMIADEVAWPKIKIAGTTAFLAATVGEDAAVAYWTSGGRPGKAPSNRAERRKTSKSTGAAKKTPRPASTSGTSSRSRGATS
jgi:hypothetical protein